MFYLYFTLHAQKNVMYDEILQIANQRAIEYSSKVDDNDPELAFARGFVAGYNHSLDVKAKISPDRRYSQKIEHAQYFVDRYIERHGLPPTYRIVAQALGISTTATYHRLRYYRHKMKTK